MDAMKRLILLLLVFVIPLCSKTQSRCVPDTYCFNSEEKLNFEVYYNWGLIWIEAGDVEFCVSDTIIEKSDCYHFKCTAKSFKKFDWLYKVRDTIEAYSQKSSLTPIFYRSHFAERNSSSISCYNFSIQNNDVQITQKENSLRQDTSIYNLPDCTFDALTLTYALRSTDLSDLHINDTIKQNLIFNGKLAELPIVFHGNQMIKDRNEKNQECLLFSVVISEESTFLRNEKIFVYVSNDKNRFPILVEAKILVGSIKIYLSYFE